MFVKEKCGLLMKSGLLFTRSIRVEMKTKNPITSGSSLGQVNDLSQLQYAYTKRCICYPIFMNIHQISVKL